MEPIKQVVLERIYDASPEKVWQAWTDAALIKQWWGPDNVSIPEAEVDARVGGKYRVEMHAATFTNDLQRAINRERVLVMAARDQRVEHVGQRHQPC